MSPIPDDLAEQTAPPPRPDEPPRKVRKTDHNRQRMAIVLMILCWTYGYNVLIKGQGPVRGFFEILDTISDDFVMGALVTIALGLLIVAVYSLTRLYTQIIANIYSFRIIEDLVHGDLRNGRYRQFFSKLIRFEDQPHPETTCPTRVSSLLLSFAFVYAMSWIYVMLFSEALFFVSWSAGVDLPFDEHNLLLLPTIALSIPFSARVMAFLRYPYAQAYADFMPGAVFVLLMVGSLGVMFESDDQKFFLAEVMKNPEYRLLFFRNGAFLAFVPLFFEACFWIYELFRDETLQDARAAAEADAIGEADPLTRPADPQSHSQPSVGSHPD